MADEHSPAHVSSPSRDLNLAVKEAGVCYQHEVWLHENNELIDAAGPSSVEVQAGLSDSSRSISSRSPLDDFNDSVSPHNPLGESEGGENLDIMGIANTWQEEEYGSDPAVPSRGGELTCLGLGQSASSGRDWISPSILPNDLFEEDRESICELLGDVADSNSIPGVCGLRNLGNTCFMNAGLQCLINTHPLLNYFNAHSIDEQYQGCNSVHLAAQFATFLLKMWSGRFSTLRPAEFKHTLALYHPQFKDYRQHDCQEFLALLLDSLHEHLSQIGQKNGTSGAEAVEADSATGRDADLPSDCCLLTMAEEPMELYESSRSSQLSSPRSSSDSVETTSSCTTSCSSTRAKAAALSLRSLPIPEEVKQPLFPLTIPPSSQDGSVTDLLFKGSPISPRKNSLVMERNLLNPSPDHVTPLVLEKNIISESLAVMSSIIKDSKTANVNISTCSAEVSANNEIYFDSGKFPPLDPAKPRAAVAATRVHNTDCSQPLSQQQQQLALAKSKVKNTNVLKEAAKRLSEDQNLPSSSSPVVPMTEATFVGDHSLPSPNNENVTSISKKARFESGDGWQSQASSASQDNSNVLEATTSPWDSLGALGRAVKDEEPVNSSGTVCLPVAQPKESVVTQTFQGQFRSTVVCCTCKHVSITYEPFMYLSVPLPRALERPVEVVFVPESGDIAPSRHHLVLQQYDEVTKLRQMLIKVLELDAGQSERLVLAEVANRVILRILEDKILLRHITDGQHRTVYAFAVPQPAASLTPSGLVTEGGQSTVAPMSQDDPNPSQSDEPLVEHAWKSCAICLEEMPDTDLRKHTSCSCLLCQSCIEASCRHFQTNGNRQNGDYLTCPVCSMNVKPEEEFAPLDKLHHYRPIIRHLNIPILLRLAASQHSALGTQSLPSSRLIGFPRLLQLPNLISPKGLYEVVGQLYPQVNDFDLCFVDSQGVRCSRCILYPARCNGCKIRADGDHISLQPGDCLAVQIYQPEDENLSDIDTAKSDTVYEPFPSVDQDDCFSGFGSRNLREPLTLDDCLRAFSESETLDEGNPWFCPKCQKSQCASKTLSISQAPPYLIVYLKRFVFHDNSSSKLDNRVEFPLSGLNLQPYVASVDISSNGDNSGEDNIYDLYGVVCHFGSASSGHYTAYTRHVNSKDWHYYNDETVLSRPPQEEDYSHGYVLFYQRRETSIPSSSSCQEDPIVASVSDK